MKAVKILVIVCVIILFSACSPDEDTAEEMQAWFDACNLVESCSEKADQIRELELSESETIIALQSQLIDYGSTLEEIQTSIAQVNNRFEREQYFYDLESNFAAFLEENVGPIYFTSTIRWRTSGPDSYLIDIERTNLWDMLNGLNMLEDYELYESVTIDFLIAYLGELHDKSEILINYPEIDAQGNSTEPTWYTYEQFLVLGED